MASASSSWSDLLPDLLGLVLIRLPFPADRARFRAVCRAWHSAARNHVRQLPWMVFPDGSFITIGHGGSFYFSAEVFGLPKNVTCLGAAAVGWLALDCIDDDVFQRTRHSKKTKHSYQLYNPFTGKTVLLPELDSIIGEVAEMFEIRNVLVRSSSNSCDNELVAITTNNCDYNVILCRPGKGCYVVPDIDVFDVAFHGNRLFGITPEEELVALDLVEDDKGAPIVTKCRRVIKRPLVDGEEDQRSWMYDDNSSDNDDSSDDNEDTDDDGDEGEGEGEEHDSSDDDRYGDEGEGEGDDSNDDDVDEGEGEGEGEGEVDDSNHDDEDGDEGEGASQNGEQDSFIDDGRDIWINAVDKRIPYDIFSTTRHLVQSSCGDGDNKELLMVRHNTQSSPKIGTYTLSVDILKADVESGNWVPVSELAKGKAVFLSRSFSMPIHAYGDIQEGFVYYTDAKDAFDTKSGDRSFLRLPRQWLGADTQLLTWLFPPKLQL